MNVCTAPVTERALIARINRRLAPLDQAVRSPREGSLCWHSFGRRYIWAGRENRCIESHLNVEAKARELGVMRGIEYVEAAP